MCLKFKREEITWLDPKYVSKEVAKSNSFWINTELPSNKRLCCSRPNDRGGYDHFVFDMDTKEWNLLKKN